jgi:hypothetical protein
MLVQSGGSVDRSGEAGGTDTELSLRARAEPKAGSGAPLLVTPGTRVSVPLLLDVRANMALLVLRSDTRSVKRISERDATRSREGLALEMLGMLDVDATEDAIEGTRLGAFERVIDCFLASLSLGSLGSSSCCGTDASGYSGDVGVVSVIFGFSEEPWRVTSFREFVAL